MLIWAMLACAPHLPKETVEALMSGAHLEAQLGMTVHTLDNGLTVYLSENHEEARIATRIVVRAGSGQNPADATGLAHYLEHLLFNGSERLGTTDYAAEAPHLARISALYEQLKQTDDPDRAAEIYATIDAEGLAADRHYVPSELSQLYQRVGAQGLNAFTTQDSTVYVVDIPADALGLWADVEADRFSAPVLRSFQTEVEVVYEERNRADDNPGRATYHSTYAAAFPEHPYGRPSLGTIAHLKRPSVARAAQFLEDWYVPNNMAVVLAGDFDSDEALALIEAHFGAWEPRPLPAPTPLAEPLSQTTHVEIQHNGEEQVMMAWPTVPADHPDRAAVQLAAVALDNDDLHGVVDALASPGDTTYLWPQRLGSVVWFEGWIDEKHGVEQVERQMTRKLRRLHRRKPSAEHLDDYLLRMRLRELRSLEHNALRADWMEDLFVEGVDPIEYRKRLAEVSPAEVRAAAREHLGAGRVVVTRRQGEPSVPDISAPPLTPRETRTEAHSAYFDALLSAERPTLSPQVLEEGTDYLRLEGPVYVSRNPHNDQASLTLLWDIGMVTDPTLCTALRLWNDNGFVLWDEIGFNTGLSCDDQQVQIVFSGHEALLAEWVRRDLGGLRRPHPMMWGKRKWLKDALFDHAQRNRSLQQRASALGAYALSGRDSLYCRSLDPDTLESLRLRDYRRALRGLLEMPYDALYVGNASPEEIVEMLPTPSTEGPAPVPKAVVHPASDRTLFVQHDAVQASLQVVLPYGAQTLDDRAVADVVSRYLKDLLNQEIRERRGLAYVASGGLRQGERPSDDSYAWARADVQADKAAEAAALMIGLLRGGQLDPARFDQARQGVIEQHRALRTSFRGVPWVAWKLDTLGLAADDRIQQIAAVEALTVADAQAFVDRWAEQPLTLAIVGDRERIDLDAIGALAPVEELSPEDIFTMQGQDTKP